MDPGHLLHSALSCPSRGNARHLKSKHLLYLLHNNSSVHLTIMTEVRRCGRITDGMRKGWRALRDSVLSCRLRTGVRLFRSCLHKSGISRNFPWHKWCMAASAACECGAEDQTVNHVVFQCPNHRPPPGLHGLAVLDDEKIDRLLNNCAEIQCGQAVDWKIWLKRWWWNSLRLRTVDIPIYPNIAVQFLCVE